MFACCAGRVRLFSRLFPSNALQVLSKPGGKFEERRYDKSVWVRHASVSHHSGWGEESAHPACWRRLQNCFDGTLSDGSRGYPACCGLADGSCSLNRSTNVESISYSLGTSKGFKSLFNYISGANHKNETIPMTVPVKVRDACSKFQP